MRSSAMTMLVFDCLLDDYVENEAGNDACFWRTNCFMYKLHESELINDINS